MLRVVRAVTEQVTSVDVFNLEVEYAHNYFVYPEVDGAAVLVHNKAAIRNIPYVPSGPLAGRRVGHTYSKHGSHNTHQLQMQAKNSGRAQGQWVDDTAAENIIGNNLNNLSQGTIDIEIPAGVGRVVNPDGTFSPATHARLVPSGSGVKTAYPIIPD